MPTYATDRTAVAALHPLSDLTKNSNVWPDTATTFSELQSLLTAIIAANALLPFEPVGYTNNLVRVAGLTMQARCEARSSSRRRRSTGTTSARRAPTSSHSKAGSFVRTRARTTCRSSSSPREKSSGTRTSGGPGLPHDAARKRALPRGADEGTDAVHHPRDRCGRPHLVVGERDRCEYRDHPGHPGLHGVVLGLLLLAQGSSPTRVLRKRDHPLLLGGQRPGQPDSAANDYYVFDVPLDGNGDRRTVRSTSSREPPGSAC